MTDRPPPASPAGSDKPDPPGQDDRLAQGYATIMRRAREMLHRAEEARLPSLQELLDAAKRVSVELGELTRDEAERIGMWVSRDLNDAAAYLRDTGSDLRDWLRFDAELVEERLREQLEVMVDHTQQELGRLAADARAASEVHTGQVTAPGTLFCQSCGQAVTLHGSGRVPPCPKCRGTVFARAVALGKHED